VDLRDLSQVDWEPVAAAVDRFSVESGASTESRRWYTSRANTVAGQVAIDSDGTVIGTALIVRNPGGGLEIGKVWVSPHARRQGLARKLNSACVDEAAQLSERVDLMCLRDNAQAVALYRDLGFLETDRIPWDCEDNSEVIVWTHPRFPQEKEH